MLASTWVALSTVVLGHAESGQECEASSRQQVQGAAPGALRTHRGSEASGRTSRGVPRHPGGRCARLLCCAWRMAHTCRCAVLHPSRRCFLCTRGPQHSVCAVSGCCVGRRPRLRSDSICRARARPSCLLSLLGLFLLALVRRLLVLVLRFGAQWGHVLLPWLLPLPVPEL